jgi:murein DD-endopeptidase MepM/ murein hydrolase activator NlpD
MMSAIDWAEQMAGPLAQKSPLSPTKDDLVATLRGTVSPVTGKLIGTPYQGTHTIGNWESDNAVDIAVPTGTPVRAVADGVIGPQFGSLGSSGRFEGDRLHLITAHNEFYYAHLSSYAAGIKPGTHVKKGQVLGYSGAANGVEHLHFGEKKGDPTIYVKPRKR